LLSWSRLRAVDRLARHEGSPVTRSQLRVLVVDDEADIPSMLPAVLRRDYALISKQPLIVPPDSMVYLAKKRDGLARVAGCRWLGVVLYFGYERALGALAGVRLGLWGLDRDVLQAGSDHRLAAVSGFEQQSGGCVVGDRGRGRGLCSYWLHGQRL
jgi:hypothetical protein